MARTGDVATLSNLSAIYEKVGDYERAAETCERYFKEVPEEDDFMHLKTCLGVAVVRGDKAGEAVYLKRLLAAVPPEKESEACVHADLASLYLKYSCRSDDVLREADLAIKNGCAEVGAGPRRSALMRLKRYEEASEPPPDGKFFNGRHGEEKTDPRVAYGPNTARAMALIMLNQDQAALEILRPIADKDDIAQILIGMIDNGVARERIAARPICKPVASRADRLAGAAAGYLGYQMFDEARGLIDQALALDPKSAGAWAGKVYLLSLDGKVKEAVKAGEEALAMGIDDPIVEGNLGYAYQQLGQCDKAIPLFKKKMVGEPWTVPNYTNLAKCLEVVGQDAEAKATWKYVQWGRPGVRWWMFVLIIGLALGLYLGAKLALIVLMPGRFGHLKFP